MEKQSHFIKIDGQHILVSEEVYRAYKQPRWAEHKRKERDGKGVSWMKDCSQCSYYHFGKGPTGTALSLDSLFEETEYETHSNENV